MKKNIFYRLLAMLVTLALVFGAILLVVYRDTINFDALSRWFTYRSLEQQSNGQTGAFPYEGQESDAFANLGGDLLIGTRSAIRIYDPSGVEFWDVPITMTNPTCVTSGSVGVVYDLGGVELRVLSNRTEVFSYTAAAGSTIVDASINANGYLVITTNEAGFKGVMTVYDSQYEPVMALRISSRFVVNAVLSDDNKTLGVATIEQSDSGFQSTLFLYTTDGNDTPFAQYSLGNDTVLSLVYQSGSFWVLGEYGVCAVDDDGTLLGDHSFDDLLLKNSAWGDGFATVLLGEHRVTTNGTLMTVDENGEVLGTLAVNEQIVSLSTAGRYVAVLYAKHLDIYTKDFTLYSSSSDTAMTERVLQNSDGSAILIGGDWASVYLPQ